MLAALPAGAAAESPAAGTAGARRPSARAPCSRRSSATAHTTCTCRPRATTRSAVAGVGTGDRPAAGGEKDGEQKVDGSLHVPTLQHFSGQQNPATVG